MDVDPVSPVIGSMRWTGAWNGSWRPEPKHCGKGCARSAGCRSATVAIGPNGTGGTSKLERVEPEVRKPGGSNLFRVSGLTPVWLERRVKVFSVHGLLGKKLIQRPLRSLTLRS